MKKRMQGKQKAAQKSRNAEALFPVKKQLATAFLVSVINPILQGLETEQYFLAKKNWTWRYTTGALESIWSISAYVDIRYLPNYEAFRRTYSNTSRLIDSHDTAVFLLTALMNRSYNELRSYTGLQSLMEEARKSFEASGGDYESAFGAVPAEHRGSLVIEYLLNNITDPQGECMAPFWRHACPLFRAGLEPCGLSAKLSQIAKTGKALEDACGEVKNSLDLIRRFYTKRYGIPPVPVEIDSESPHGIGV